MTPIPIPKRKVMRYETLEEKASELAKINELIGQLDKSTPEEVEIIRREFGVTPQQFLQGRRNQLLKGLGLEMAQT
jgi:hypothetical protein